MKEKVMIAAALAALCAAQAAEFKNDIAKWDPNFALQKGTCDTAGIRWMDGSTLPMEGRAYDNTDQYYDRLPSDVPLAVNAGVRSMKHHTSGLQLHFVTDSPFINIKCQALGSTLAMNHMPATGMSGIDVYYRDKKTGKWCFRWSGTAGANGEGRLDTGWTPGEECLINLPPYNGVKTLKIGIATNATVWAAPPRTSGVSKPVVFYGTSITHGGCSSRPGNTFVNIMGRDLDVPIVNLGFSGSGWMEFEMSDLLARIDASCYVLDCLWNMGETEKERPGRSVERNYEKFIRNLRAKRPDVPIVMAEACIVHKDGRGPYDDRLTRMNRRIRALYEKLVAEGWKDLHYLPNTDMYLDTDGTVDGIHPNDWGMKSMAAAFGKAVAAALKLK